MLKYQINKRNLIDDNNKLAITNIQCYTHPNTVNDTMDVVCEYCTDIGISKGDNLFVNVVTKVDSSQTDYFQREFNIEEINYSENTFMFTTPQYINLDIKSIEEQKEVNDIEGVEKPYWWYFTFNEFHYFDTEHTENIRLFVDYYVKGELKTMELSSNFEIIDSVRVKYNPTQDEKNGDFAQTIFSTNYNENAPSGLADMFTIRFVKREHFFITNDLSTISIYKNRYNLDIQLPLFSSNRTDLLKQYSIDERFFEVEREKVINKGIEMEKSIFTPVFKNNTDVKEVYKINFNIHLRHHSEDEEWKTTDDDYWNGVYYNTTDKETLEIKKEFFSESYKDCKERQSDNLYLMGFTDNDVMYQKSRLKKTFLRLSIYDSPYLTEQNLIGYSTIFLDSNRLFAKKIKNLRTEGYKTYSFGNGSNVKTGLIGIGVKREFNSEVDDVENYRLSSQFSVQDRYSSSDCSEGFYLYLWKNYIQGTTPRDLYIHIDVNHARFGRSLPLMMPFFGPLKNDSWDGACEYTWKEEVKKGVKSFDDIVNDWNNGGYNIQRYLRYSYIHFKCKYDKENNRNIYYLDDDFYGSNIIKLFDDNTNTLNLSLYEAKISDGQDIKTNNETNNDENNETANPIQY